MNVINLIVLLILFTCMSRSRNRNIKQIFKNEPIRSNNVPAIYFGEYIFSNAVSNDFMEANDSVYPNIDTTDNFSVSKSSSSSLSWGEDCEIEATERVKHDYEKMNSILSGLDAIPQHYDKDEYKLWIKTFPSLRQEGLSVAESEKRHSQNSTKFSRNKCDNLPYMEPNSNAVIDDFLKKIPNLPGNAKVLNSKRRHRVKQKNHENDSNSLRDDLRDNFANILRISPAPTYDKYVNLESRRLATNYVRRVDLLHSNNKEYTSLPHLLPQLTENYLTVKNAEVVSRRKQKRHQKTSKVVLPPINVSPNQFRSISAIPLQQNKCSSALSTKTNFVFDFKNTQKVINSSSVNKRKLNGYF